MILDLNTHDVSDSFEELLDKALSDYEESKRIPRQYLGASRLGVDCKRALQFEIMNVPVDPGKEISGRIYRIFYRGHQGEEWMKLWMAQAGFIIDGTQDGFELCDGLIAGHVDGIITAGPEKFGPYPKLWENKVLGSKGIGKLRNHRLRKGYPVYYGQMQIYMAAMDLDKNPGLFTALNADTMSIYAESVEFDGEYAQRTYTGGELVIRACQDGIYLDRISQDPCFFVCKMCNWHDRCHAMVSSEID